MIETLSFKHFITVEHRPGEDELTNYRAHKRKHIGESIESLSTDEEISMSTRLKMGRSAKRNKAKMALGRKRAARRFASGDVLKKRARKAAYQTQYAKIIKTIPKDKLSPARKAEIEKRLKSPAFQGRIDKMSKKMIKDVRKAEMARKRAN